MSNLQSLSFSRLRTFFHKAEGSTVPWELHDRLNDRAAAPPAVRARPDPAPATALIHDFLAQAGGAERVVAALHALFPSAPLYTSVYDPNGDVSQVCDARAEHSWGHNPLLQRPGRDPPALHFHSSARLIVEVLPTLRSRST